MLKVVENYTLRRGWSVSASLGMRWCVRLWVRLYLRLYPCLYLYLPAKAGRASSGFAASVAFVIPVLSRVAARPAMQEAP